jgi:UDP-glucose 4-epimerase
LVLFAFENANQGDIFIRKAESATIADLAQAVKNIMGKPDHPVEVIGWRHGEKLYESLASGREMVEAEDMGDYMRLPLDARRINYDKYFTEGSTEVVEEPEYSSHSVERISMPDLEALLLSLDEVQEQRRLAGVA